MSSYLRDTTLGGSPGNGVESGVFGAVIAGGGTLNDILDDDDDKDGKPPSGSVQKNLVKANYSNVSGGENNKIGQSAPHAAIGGGKDHEIKDGAEKAHIGGGEKHSIKEDAKHAHIGGGLQHSIGARAEKAGISSGELNTVGDDAKHAHVGGGIANKAMAEKAHVGGGASNEIYAAHCSISGGLANTIKTNSNYSTVSGGYQNTITASAPFSTIPGGSLNTVGASSSFAAGHRAQANHQGTFVWADSQEADFGSSNTNQFAVRAQNGVVIQAQTNATALELRTGGAIKVTGAGVGTGTPIFIHRATAANTAAHITTIDNPLCNGDASAILLVTHNWSQDTASQRYETVPVGVWYNGAQWTIFHEDAATAMPVGRAFNVMIVKQ